MTALNLEVAPVAMNLHRSGKEAQWESVEPEDRNVFQTVAAKTNGIVTPANAVDAIGAGLVASGLKDISRNNTAKGVVKVGLGRIADLVDGFIAERTGTKSPLGEGLDVIIDKTETAGALPVLVKADILPKSVAGMIVAQNMANTAFSAVAKQRGAEIHPSREGKITMFGQWAAIGFYGLAAAARSGDAPRIADGMEIVADVCAATTTVLAPQVVSGYARDAFAPVA